MGRPFRLPDFHYGAGASYFVTFCTHRRQRVLSEVREGSVELSAVGEILLRCWTRLPERFPGLAIDEFVIMPDHFHGIVHLADQASAKLSPVIQALKGVVSIESRRAGIWISGRLWQRSFHDRVIRGPKELDQIRVYVRNNPLGW